MKTDTVKSLLKHWPSIIALAFLASCGGSDGNDNAAVPTSTSSTTSTLVATLSGAQETPPNGSLATGTGAATVDTATKVLGAAVTTTGIAGTAAHIHLGAPGVSGPILFPLTQTPAGSGIWSTRITLSDAQLNQLMAGNYYFNVHSTAFPNGEIRGQIVAQQTPQPLPQDSMDGGGGGGY
jgi:hypothetical protein